MPNVVSFKTFGFAETAKALDNIPQAFQQKALTPLLIKALKPIKETAEAIAPDDPRTGAPDLHRSLVVSDKQRSGRQRSNTVLGQYSARAWCGPDKGGYPQAIFDEFGTYKMEAQPYLRPTWDTRKDEVLNIIREGFADAVTYAVKLYGVRSGV